MQFADLSKTFLHVGCGSITQQQTTAAFAGSSWRELRLDIDPAVKPDIVGTMTNMVAVADQSVDAIFSSHNIEHLYAHEIPLALREFLRVLKSDGFAVVTCPDLQSVAVLVAQDKLTEPAYISPKGPIAPLDILYGFRPSLAAGNLFMAHHCGFTEKALTNLLMSCGFASVVSRRRPLAFDLWAVAAKSAMPEDTLRALAIQHFPP
jgi:SAM-dependent methyltransferase